MKPPDETKILIVEDDVYFQRVLHKRLSSDGYQVMTAADGREGMKAIVSWDPDLVISDWMMPQVDGLELCQSVKTGLKEAAPYFILLTAKGEISDRLLALDTGADDYLVKPCDQGELMARVRSGLRNVLLARELRQAVSQLRSVAAELEVARAKAARAALPSCRICQRVQLSDGSWQELHDYVTGQRILDLAPAVCPQCDHGRAPAEKSARENGEAPA